MIDPPPVGSYQQPTLQSPRGEIDLALRLLRTLCQAISQAPGFEAALQQMLHLVCTQTCWAFGEVWLPTGDRCLHHSGLWYSVHPALDPFGQQSTAWQFAPHEGLPGRVWMTGQVEWIANVAQVAPDRFLRRDLAVQYRLGAGISVPIGGDGQVLAVLVLLATEERQRDDDQVQLVEAIAAQLGFILQLKRTEAELTAQQNYLHRLLDALPGIVFTAQGPPHWEMRTLSDGCYRLTGYTNAELICTDSSITFNDVTHPEDLPRVLKTIQAALDTSTTYEVEYRIITRDGEIKWVWEKGQGVFDEAGIAQGLQGFITDITRLKDAEAALRQSETRYRVLAERSQDLISQHDLSGIFRYVSPACQRLLGYPATELLDRCALDFVHADDRDRIQQHYRQFLRDRQVQTLRFRIRHRNGAYRWFETIGCMIDPCSQSDDLQVLAVSRDITERVQSEQTLLEREQFLRLVLDNIPQYLFWKDRAGVYLGCNQAFAHSIGLASTTDIIGKTDWDIEVYSREDADYFRRRDQLVMKHDQPDLHVPELQPYQTGERRWISSSKFPIHDADNQVVGVLGSFEDITERLTIERALARREQYLTALVELQRQLLDFEGNWDNARYGSALKPLGEAAEASRVYIYEYSHRQPEVVIQRAEWSAPGISPTIGHPSVATMPTQGPLADWVAQLSQGDYVNLTVEQFPPLLQQVLGNAPSNVKSILLLPLLMKGRLCGCIGFSNCVLSRSWTRSEVALLRVAANAIAIAMERHQVEISLRKAEIKYRSIFENAVEGIFQTTIDGRFITANPMLAKIYGYDSPAEMIECLTDIGQQLYVDATRRDTFVSRMLQENSLLRFESAVYRKDGNTIWISESARTLYDDLGQLIGFEGTVEDITARKIAELELHRRDRLLQGVAQASQYLLTTPDLEVAIPKILAVLGDAAEADRIYIYENHPHPVTGVVAMSMRYEWTQADILPSIHQPHWHNQSYEEYGLQRWYQAFQAGCSIRGLVRNFPLAEQQLLIRDNIQAILMVPIFIDQALWGHIGFDACRDVRQWTPGEESFLVTIAASIGGALKRQYTESQMRYQAFHDPLTGLPNRVAFNQQLPLAIAQAERSRSQMAVMFLDLDRFKNINDTLGHAIGDELLIQATQRLSHGLRKNDMLARWGGDEFTLILSAIDSPEEAAAVAQRLANQLKPSFLIGDQELYITSSMGIAIHPTDGQDVTTLLQNADAAMYAAKADGRNTYRFYTTTLHSSASRQLILEKYLHQALQRREFRLFFQPQIDVRQGKICQIEALVRWESPQLGWVSPMHFIPIAEEIGLITELGDWVLEQSCRQLRTWHSQGFRLNMAVNLSARQIQTKTLVRNVEQTLKETALPPQYLELEITETAALSDVEASITTLSQLRDLGTRIVMDDFGTGYSSLSYLKRLPFQGLKIDRAFVQGIPADTQDVAMLRAMIALAEELRLSIVAEGVETWAQRDCLHTLGCTKMQGFLFSPPLNASAMTAFLHHHWPTYNADQAPHHPGSQ